ncbi:hypothetical protein HY357_01835, partial [Candidatus Roizmanbacteria bacterium]|nr:hypothetical protein [Candidatus Roizmanbacteria bacterium]
LQPANITTIYTNPIFGKVKKPFLKNASLSAGLNFKIDTIEGKPTTATESAKVYFLPSAPTRFGYREKIYLAAKTLGFDTELIKHKLDGKEATFKNSNQSLQIDITNFNFTYEYHFDSNPEIFQDTIIPDKKQSESQAISFLKAVGRYPEELAQGKTNVIFISYNPDAKQMTVLDSSENANMVEVDFYRPDLEQYPIVSPTYFNSQNYIMMLFYESDFKIIKAQIKFFEKSGTQIGTYAINSGDIAWEALKGGNGLVIQNPQDTQNVVIKKMFLGYLDPDVYQEYLQPVYVFLGEENFVAYVPAITEDYFTD